MRERCRKPPRAEALEPRVVLSTYYVSPTGSDATGGGASAPWQTLQHAADMAVAGDTVHVLAGTYNRGMNFWGKAGGTATAPIKFLADSGAIVTHCADSGRSNDSLAAINVENTGGYYVIQGFTVISDGSIERAGIRVAGNSNVQVLGNTVDRAYIGIFVSNANDLLIQGNTCTRSTDQHGIYVGANTLRTVVRGNTLWGNNWDGLHLNASYAVGPNDGAVVEDNVIYANKLSGMDVEGATHALFRNNVIYGNAKHGITFHSQDQTAAGDPTPPCAGNTVVNNTITGNGMFALIFRPEDMADTVIFNNILLSGAAPAGNYGSIGVGGSAAGLTSDYNVVNDDFSTTLGDNTISFAQWQSVTGQDQHSLVATPDQIFINPAANDYRPKPLGLSVDAGIASLAGRHAPFDDAAGKLRPRGATWDAGAYEDDTLPDTTPPVISSVQSSVLTPKRATLSWITNELADTQVEYGATNAYGQFSPLDPAVRDTHSVTLAGLTPDTTYHFRIRSRDSFGNLALSGDLTFTTPPAPTIPPVIDAIMADPWTLGATVTWKTDLPADTLFEYGPTSDYGLAISDPDLRTSHAVSFDALAPGATVHYRIRARDEYGNTTFSDDRTFTTPAVGQLPPGPAAFWTFDAPEGTTAVDDVTGNGNAATLLNGTDIVPGRDPSRGQAVKFDGFDGHVHVPRTPALEPAAVTLSAWVKLVLGADQATWVTVIKKDYADDTPPIFGSFSLSISPPGKPNVLSFYTGHAGGNNDQLDSPTALLTGQWIHVAGTYDPATGEKRLYVNGALVASRALTRPIAYDPTPAGDLYIGKDPGPGEAFRGSIDDVGLWPRALTANEIRTLAFGRPATYAAPTDLITTVLTYTRVRLAWTDHTGGVARYLVQRRPAGGQWTDVTSLDPGVTTFDDPVAHSQIFEYRVYAYDALTSSEPSPVALVSTKAGGTGLIAEYFDTRDLTGSALTRVDPTLNFAWAGASPITGVAPGTYSVRWTGQVIAFETGAYKFFTTADDGVRLWVNGQLIIDRWADRPELAGDVNGDGVVNFTDYQIFQRQDRTTNPQSDFNHDGIVDFADFQILYGNMNKTLADTVPTNYGAITLQAGVKYDIRLEYFQDAGIATLKLGWITPAQTRELIPMDALFPILSAPAPDPVATRPATTPTTKPATPPTAPKPAVPPPPKPVFCAQPVKKEPALPRRTVVLPPVVPPKKPAAKAKAAHR